MQLFCAFKVNSIKILTKSQKKSFVYFKMAQLTLNEVMLLT